MIRCLSKLSPFPTIEGIVEHGFGRGSKQLGFPTANLNSSSSDSVASFLSSEGCKDGIYIGWVSLGPESGPMKSAISVGINPTFEDSKVRLLEAHIIGYNGEDFYGKPIRVVLCGWIRPTLRFTTVEALREEISADCVFASEAMDRETDLSHAQFHEFLKWDS